MATDQIRQLYEVLLRFGGAGIVGASQRYLRRVVDTESGEVISELAEPPEPLAPEALAGLMESQVQYMTAQLPVLLALADARAARITHLEQAMVDQAARLQAASDLIAAYTQTTEQLQNATDMVISLQRDAADKAQRIAALEALVADQAQLEAARLSAGVAPDPVPS